MAGARDLPSVAALAARCGGLLMPRQLAALLARAAALGSAERRSRPGWRSAEAAALADAVRSLCALCRRRWQEFDLPECVSMLESFCQLGLYDDSTVALLLRGSQRRLAAGGGSQLAAMATALARLGVRPEASWLRAFNGAVLGAAPQLAPQEANGILRSLAGFAPEAAAGLRDELLRSSMAAAVETADSLPAIAAVAERYGQVLPPSALCQLVGKLASAGRARGASGSMDGYEAVSATGYRWKQRAVTLARSLFQLSKDQLRAGAFGASEVSEMLRAVAELGFYDPELVSGLLATAQVH